MTRGYLETRIAPVSIRRNHLPVDGRLAADLRRIPAREIYGRLRNSVGRYRAIPENADEVGPRFADRGRAANSTIALIRHGDFC